MCILMEWNCVCIYIYIISVCGAKDSSNGSTWPDTAFMWWWWVQLYKYICPASPFPHLASAFEASGEGWKKARSHKDCDYCDASKYTGEMRGVRREGLSAALFRRIARSRQMWHFICEQPQAAFSPRRDEKKQRNRKGGKTRKWI